MVVGGTGNMQAYEQLEQEFAAWVGWPNMVACSSGSAALHLALEALQLPRESQVTVPEYTMISCARAVTLAGLNPVFVDCNNSLLIDPDLIPQGNHTDTVATMPVHVYGRRCNMESIIDVAKRDGLYIIEDLAEAHGIAPHPQTTAACWSFYRNKIIAGEEGGIVAFRCKEHANLAKQLRSVGFTAQHDFLHAPRGMNYRLANILAKPILQSLSRAGANLAKRRAIEAWYNRAVPKDWQMPSRGVCWVYDVRLPPSIDTASVVRRMNDLGHAARLGFKPMSQQQEYYSASYRQLNASRLGGRILYLPVAPAMTKDEVDRIVSDLCLAAAPLPQPYRWVSSGPL